MCSLTATADQPFALPFSEYLHHVSIAAVRAKGHPVYSPLGDSCTQVSPCYGLLSFFWGVGGRGGEGEVSSRNKTVYRN